QRLPFFTGPLSVDTPPAPSEIFLVHTVQIYRIPGFNFQCFEPFLLPGCSDNCSFCNIFVQFVPDIPDMYGHIHMLHWRNPQCLHSPARSGTAGHCSVTLPVCPSDTTKMTLVGHFSFPVLPLLKNARMVKDCSIRIFCCLLSCTTPRLRPASRQPVQIALRGNSRTVPDTRILMKISSTVAGIAGIISPVIQAIP